MSKYFLNLINFLFLQLKLAVNANYGTDISAVVN